MSPMTQGLVAEGLCAGYGGVAVLADVDLTVAPASIVAVLGANGAGKTTLLRTLAGQLRPIAGRVLFAGRDLTTTPVEERVRYGVATVAEGGGIVGELTVEQNLRLGALWRREPSATELARVYELFEPLARRRKHLGHQLSGGERQMLAVGRALLAQPRLLLLDEPSLGLAPVAVAALFATLARQRAETGLAVLLVEQNVHSALSIADSGVVLAQGRVALTGESATMLQDYAVRHAYLGF